MEIERKQAEMVAAQVIVEQLRQQDQLLTIENEMLKVKLSSIKSIFFLTPEFLYHTFESLLKFASVFHPTILPG